MKNIIETQVWCYGKTQEELDREKDLGLSLGEDDIWIPMAIDFSKIIAIKEALETEFLGHGKATIYFFDERVTINMKFEEAVEIWKKS